MRRTRTSLPLTIDTPGRSAVSSPANCSAKAVLGVAGQHEHVAADGRRAASRRRRGWPGRRRRASPARWRARPSGGGRSADRRPISRIRSAAGRSWRARSRWTDACSALKPSKPSLAARRTTVAAPAPAAPARSATVPKPTSCGCSRTTWATRRSAAVSWGPALRTRSSTSVSDMGGDGSGAAAPILAPCNSPLPRLARSPATTRPAPTRRCWRPSPRPTRATPSPTAPTTGPGGASGPSPSCSARRDDAADLQRHRAPTSSPWPRCCARPTPSSAPPARTSPSTRRAPPSASSAPS